MLDLSTTIKGTELWFGEYRVGRLVCYDTAGVLIADVRVSSAYARDWAETDAGKSILQALAAGPLTGKELSVRAGYKGGRFREVLTGLVGSGRVEKDGSRFKLALGGQDSGS